MSKKVALANMLLLSCISWASTAFTPLAGGIAHRASAMHHASSSRLFVLSQDGMNDEVRMVAVRTLQDSFYGSTNHEPPVLDESTGIMRNLPLWRVGWAELPGRSNCLNVHEGQYTHMFEQLLRGPEPWYFGHLFLTSRNLRASPLVTYREDTELSAQVGCLMRVRDYRRQQDGGLILFVQVMDRFVVDTVLQSLPFSKAHVQILPDTSSRLVDDTTDESSASLQRAKQVQKSFQYHDYEYADTKLPQSDYIDPNMPIDTEQLQILQFSFYAQAESLLPLSFYSQNDSSLKCIATKDSHDANDSDDKLTLSSYGGQPSLERQLVKRGVLKEPSRIRRTADDSETLIWMALEEYSRTVQMPLPEQVLCLKPPEMEPLDLPDAAHPLSPEYPKSRRQERLSYNAAGFLDNKIWQDLLELSSTEARLEAVLLKLHEKQDAILGKFQ